MFRIPLYLEFYKLFLMVQSQSLWLIFHPNKLHVSWTRFWTGTREEWTRGRIQWYHRESCLDPTEVVQETEIINLGGDVVDHLQTSPINSTIITTVAGVGQDQGLVIEDVVWAEVAVHVELSTQTTMTDIILLLGPGPTDHPPSLATCPDMITSTCTCQDVTFLHAPARTVTTPHVRQDTTAPWVPTGGK